MLQLSLMRLCATRQGDITDEEFRAHFAQFGEMDDCVVRFHSHPSIRLE